MADFRERTPHPHVKEEAGRRTIHPRRSPERGPPTVESARSTQAQRFESWTCAPGFARTRGNMSTPQDSPRRRKQKARRTKQLDEWRLKKATEAVSPAAEAKTPAAAAKTTAAAK
jgi:hypothetical protein